VIRLLLWLTAIIICLLVLGPFAIPVLAAIVLLKLL
jgi:hypothetical protein